MKYRIKRLSALMLAFLLMFSLIALFFSDGGSKVAASNLGDFEDALESMTPEEREGFEDQCWSEFGISPEEFAQLSEEEYFEMMWEEGMDEYVDFFEEAILNDWLEQEGIDPYFAERYSIDDVDEDFIKDWLFDEMSLDAYYDPGYDFPYDSLEDAWDTIAAVHGCPYCDWEGIITTDADVSVEYYMDLDEEGIADVQNCEYCEACDMHFHEEDTCGECGRHLCESAHCVNGHCFEDYYDHAICDGSEFFQVGCGGDCVLCCLEDVICEEGENCVCCPNSPEYEDYHCPECGLEYGSASCSPCDSCGAPCDCQCEGDRCPDCDMCPFADEYEENHCELCHSCSETWTECDGCGEKHCPCLKQPCPDCGKTCNLQCVYCDACGHCVDWAEHDENCDFCPHCMEQRDDRHLTCAEHVKAIGGEMYCPSVCANSCEYCPDCGSCTRVTEPCPDCGAPCDCYCREHRCEVCGRCERSCNPCVMCGAPCAEACRDSYCENCGFCDNAKHEYFGTDKCERHRDCPCRCFCEHGMCFEDCPQCDKPMDAAALAAFAKRYDITVKVYDETGMNALSGVSVFISTADSNRAVGVGVTDSTGALKTSLDGSEAGDYIIQVGAVGEETVTVDQIDYILDDASRREIVLPAVYDPEFTPDTMFVLQRDADDPADSPNKSGNFELDIELRDGDRQVDWMDYDAAYLTIQYTANPVSEIDPASDGFNSVTRYMLKQGKDLQNGRFKLSIGPNPPRDKGAAWVYIPEAEMRPGVFLAKVHFGDEINNVKPVAIADRTFVSGGPFWAAFGYPRDSEYYTDAGIEGSDPWHQKIAVPIDRHTVSFRLYAGDGKFKDDYAAYPFLDYELTKGNYKKFDYQLGEDCQPVPNDPDKVFGGWSGYVEVGGKRLPLRQNAHIKKDGYYTLFKLPRGLDEGRVRVTLFPKYYYSLSKEEIFQKHKNDPVMEFKSATCDFFPSQRMYPGTLVTIVPRLGNRQRNVIDISHTFPEESLDQLKRRGSGDNVYYEYRVPEIAENTQVEFDVMFANGPIKVYFPPEMSMARGKSLRIEPSIENWVTTPAYNLEIRGNKSADTRISGNNLLTIGGDETARKLKLYIKPLDRKAKRLVTTINVKTRLPADYEERFRDELENKPEDVTYFFEPNNGEPVIALKGYKGLPVIPPDPQFSRDFRFTYWSKDKEGRDGISVDFPNPEHWVDGAKFYAQKAPVRDIVVYHRAALPGGVEEDIHPITVFRPKDFRHVCAGDLQIHVKGYKPVLNDFTVMQISPYAEEYFCYYIRENEERPAAEYDFVPITWVEFGGKSRMTMHRTGKVLEPLEPTVASDDHKRPFRQWCLMSDEGIGLPYPFYNNSVLAPLVLYAEYGYVDDLEPISFDFDLEVSYVDRNGKSVAGTETFRVRTGDTVTLAQVAKVIPKMQLDPSMPESFKMKSEAMKWELVYVPEDEVLLDVEPVNPIPEGWENDPHYKAQKTPSADVPDPSVTEPSTTNRETTTTALTTPTTGPTETTVIEKIAVTVTDFVAETCPSIVATYSAAATAESIQRADETAERGTGESVESESAGTQRGQADLPVGL